MSAGVLGSLKKSPSLKHTTFSFGFEVGIQSLDLKHLCAKLNHVEFKSVKITKDSKVVKVVESVIVTDVPSGGVCLEVFPDGKVKASSGSELHSEAQAR